MKQFTEYFDTELGMDLETFLKEDGFIGVDASLDESLNEYIFIWNPDTGKLVWKGIDDGIGYKGEVFPFDVYQEFEDFVLSDEEYLQSFAEYIGVEQKYLLRLKEGDMDPFMLFSMIQYFGDVIIPQHAPYDFDEFVEVFNKEYGTNFRHEQDFIMETSKVLRRNRLHPSKSKRDLESKYKQQLEQKARAEKKDNPVIHKINVLLENSVEPVEVESVTDILNEDKYYDKQVEDAQENPQKYAWLFKQYNVKISRKKDPDLFKKIDGLGCTSPEDDAISMNDLMVCVDYDLDKFGDWKYRVENIILYIEDYYTSGKGPTEDISIYESIKTMLNEENGMASDGSEIELYSDSIIDWVEQEVEEIMYDPEGFDMVWDSYGTAFLEGDNPALFEVLRKKGCITNQEEITLDEVLQCINYNLEELPETEKLMVKESMIEAANDYASQSDFEYRYETEIYNFTHYLKEMEPKLESEWWLISSSNVGWRNLLGHTVVRGFSPKEMATEIVETIRGLIYDSTLTIYGKEHPEKPVTLKASFSHHDSPTGEYYEITNITMDFIRDSIEMDAVLDFLYDLEADHEVISNLLVKERDVEYENLEKFKLDVFDTVEELEAEVGDLGSWAGVNQAVDTYKSLVDVEVFFDLFMEIIEEYDLLRDVVEFLWD